MIIYIKLQLGIKDQVIRVIDEKTDQVKTILKTEMENIPETLSSFYYNFNCNEVTIAGPKHFCTRIAERSKEKALELYADKEPMNIILMGD